jgi:predicted O-methyltransferase YrrM
MKEWISKLYENPELLRMGHCQRLEDLNLGFGWLYYALSRLLRPTRVVVIGSYRGFAPIVFGKALSDNSEGGSVLFIDPSLVDDFWKDASKVRQYFETFGVSNIRHFPLTTQAFVNSEEYRSLSELGIVLIDGYHSEEQARFDFEAFQSRVSPEGIILLHDSVEVSTSRIYGPERAYERTVRLFVDSLKENPCLQVLDLPFAHGLTLVRKNGAQLEKPERQDGDGNH